MVDNLRCAVRSHPRGGPAEFVPRDLDFARHYGFEIVACAVAKGKEKGRVERSVGYVQGNFLRGLDLPDFAALNPAIKVWLESVANVRLHRETRRRPVDLWQEERTHPRTVNPRHFEAFSSEYIAHLIEARTRQLPEASPLSLMRRQDVLELELPPADLSAYAKVTGDENGSA